MRVVGIAGIKVIVLPDKSRVQTNSMVKTLTNLDRQLTLLLSVHRDHPCLCPSHLLYLMHQGGGNSCVNLLTQLYVCFSFQ